MSRCASSVFVFAVLAVTIGSVPVASQVTTGPRPTVPGGITDKPYLKNFQGGIALGGYMDHELLIRSDRSDFDQHRFIPFIFAQPVDYIHVASEIEFEHGGFVAGEDETDGEIKLEYAFMDWVIGDALNFRGGVILTPLGKFNLTHDSPLNDLTNRPLVTRQLIPTTLSESGMGVFGALYPGEWVLGYEVYLVNGFNDGIVNSGNRLRVRGGRGSQKEDNNDNKAVAGRVSVSPALGLDFGLSAHHGKYDANDENDLTIAALDVDLQRGPLQLMGEAALVNANVTTPTTAESQAGFYGQLGYHFGFGTIRRYPESVFTGIVRWDLVDFDTDRAGDDQQVFTLGLNFRPIEGTAVKADYGWDWTRGVYKTTWSAPNELFSFSLATYF